MLAQSASANKAASRISARGDASIPWRERPFLSLQRTSEILGDVSIAKLYGLQSEGRLTFHRLDGRTLVETSSVIVLVEAPEPWSASKRGAEARAKRVETARSNWRD